MKRRFTKSARRLTVVSALLATVFIFSLHFGKTSAAASSYSITMTPSSTELSAPPGGSTNSSFTVVNEGTTNYTMDVSVSPYHVVGENYDPQFSVLPGTTDASKWIQLSGPSSQALGAGKLQKIDYTLNVPAGTAPGGYYAVVFAEAIPPSKAGVTSVNRVGDILYITVDGPVQKTGDLKAAKLPYVVFGNSLPLGLIVQDTGGLHFLTNAHLSARSLFGREAFQASLQRYVLPQTQRLISVKWNSLPLLGVYKVSRDATVFGTDQQLPTRWVIIIRPWLLICIIVALVLIVAVAVLTAKLHKGPANKGERGKPDVPA